MNIQFQYENDTAKITQFDLFLFFKKIYLWKPYTPVQRNKASKQVIIITGSVTGEVMIMVSF